MESRKYINKINTNNKSLLENFATIILRDDFKI